MYTSLHAPTRAGTRHALRAIQFTAAALFLTACSPDTSVAPRADSKLAIGQASLTADPVIPARTALSFLQADQPTTISAYAPFNRELHHFAEVDRFGTLPQYLVRFGGPVIDTITRKIDLVTTFGSAAAQCSSPGPTHFITEARSVVTCLDVINGTLVAAPFGILIAAVGAGFPAPFAFAYGDQPTVASYTPDPSRSFTTGTGAMLIERIGVGDWYVHLGTGSSQGTMVHVNSSDMNSVCAIAEWKNFGVRVKCFSRTGVPADIPFKVLQVAHGRPDAYFGYAWADQRTPTTPYVPARALYVNHGVSGSIRITRSGVGTYVVEFTSATPTDIRGWSTQVTPFSSTFAACAVVGETQTAVAGGNSHVETIECRNEHEILIDSRFNITLIA